MAISKIYNSEIADMKISALPSRPTAPTAYGGMGYTAVQMKEAFDRLPLYIVERFNALVDQLNDFTMDGGSPRARVGKEV